MTKVKFCGMRRPEDIDAANALCPDYVGFVFVPGRRRYVSPNTAAALRSDLDPRIRAVGVFIDEEPEAVALLCRRGIIDMAQLHGNEDESYIARLRALTDKPIIKAYRINSDADTDAVNTSSADFVLLDSGAGTGVTFDWSHIDRVTRPYFLAGGLSVNNVTDAVRQLHPYAVDVSSGIETDGLKDASKMWAFINNVKNN